MSLATLERAILASTRIALNNPKLKLKDIQEWSTGEVKPVEGEIIVWLDDPGVYVAVKKECDKRSR